MRKLIVILLMLICNLANSQTGWFLQTTPTTKNLLDIFFINSQTGWACGDSGRIIKTTNGGSIWTEIPPFTVSKLNVIRFYNSNFGYVAGGLQTQDPFCIDNDILAKTTNGGETWTTLLSNSTWDIFYDLAVLNKDTIFATYAGTDNFCMGSSGGTYSSFNGGSNWNQFGNGWMKGISFINSSTGWATTYNISDVMIGFFRVLKTTNTGVNWNLVYGDTTLGGSYIGKIRFVDANNGYTFKRMLRKTTNGGVNWQIVDSATTYFANSFALANKDTLWILKNSNSVLRTNNSGANWIQQLSAGGLNSIYFLDKNSGWIAGNNGIIYTTVTGGLTDVQNISTEIPSVYSLKQNYPNPFNPRTVISFQLPAVSNVKLRVYDITGKEVAMLVNERLQAGTYETTFDGSGLNSGVYFYKLITDGFTETKKMILLK